MRQNKRKGADVTLNMLKMGLRGETRKPLRLFLCCPRGTNIQHSANLDPGGPHMAKQMEAADLTLINMLKRNSGGELRCSRRLNI